MSEIVVTVCQYGRKFLYMRYRDPVSGKTIAKSTGTTIMKEAIKLAAKWEAELQQGRYKPASKVTWKEFRERYESEVLASLATKTESKVSGVFNSVEQLINPDKLAKLTADQLSRFQRRLRDERKLSEITIKNCLSHLVASLRWAKKVGLLSEVPLVEMPKRANSGKLMKGRPITTEEFERVLAKVPEVICRLKQPAAVRQPDDADRLKSAQDNWTWFLRGLWFSGLRLAEALDLSWDESGHITIDFSDRFPMFFIPADKQKSGKDELLPVAPEFATMLQAVPLDERHGPVFKLGRRDPTRSPGPMFVSKAVSAIGEAAGVVVNKTPLKYASCHDFRRSFGERWSTRVMPAVLQQMMRHSDISTTMRFYVGRNSQKAAAEIHAVYDALPADSKAQPTSTSTSTERKPAEESPPESTQPIAENRVE